MKWEYVRTVKNGARLLMKMYDTKILDEVYRRLLVDTKSDWTENDATDEFKELLYYIETKWQHHDGE